MSVEEWLDEHMSWVHFTANYMIRFGFMHDEAIDAGQLALIEAFADGHRELTDDVKRFVRRKMAMGSAPAWKREGVPITDHGYDNGLKTKRGPRKPPKDKHARYRHRLMSEGRCPRCGKVPEEDFVLCNTCRKKKSEQRKARRARQRADRKQDYQKRDHAGLNDRRQE